MAEPLAPCPFCGGVAIRCENFTGLAMFWTQCNVCHACPGGDHATREKADAAWNTRTQVQQASGADEREEIARIIEPEAFHDVEDSLKWCRVNRPDRDGWDIIRFLQNPLAEIQGAYAKADAILARAQGPGEAVARAAQAICDALTQDTTGRWVLDAEDPETLATSLLDALAARLGSDNDPCTLDGVTHDARPVVRHV